MTQGLLAILDSRSFGSIWFWLLLVLAWSLVGRRVLGVPADVIQAARKPQQGDDDAAALLLLDWLSLTLPRWQVGRTEGTLLLGLGTFALTALFLLGFVYGLEMAQALVLLVLPFAVLFAVELRLARQLRQVVDDAQSGTRSVHDAAAQSARRLSRHRRAVSLVSVLAVGLTAYRAALWLLAHPFGF